MSVLKRSLPIVLPSFINKLGSVGLNLVPMLLVERHFSALDSSLVMTIMRAFVFVGLFLGGHLCDLWGTKTALILSFVASALGIGLLPMASTGIWWIAAMAALAQMGNSMFPVPARLLIVDHLPPQEHQESLGWLRLANNLGQIFSYTVSFFAHSLGLSFFMLFDAFTSLLAALAGHKKIPSTKTPSLAQELRPASLAAPTRDWTLFVLVAALISGFSFIYESYMTLSAAKARLLFGENGLKVFSQIMLINTILCSLVAVHATRWIKNPLRAFPLGIILCGLGLVIASVGTQRLHFYTAAGLLTLGEIVFTALSAYVLIVVTPEVHKKGRVYGMGLALQNVGKVVGSALAFPLFVYQPLAGLYACCAVAVVLALFFAMSRRLRTFWKADPQRL